MVRALRSIPAVLGLVLALAGMSPAAAQRANDVFTAVQLPTPGESSAERIITGAAAQAINRRGQVVGERLSFFPVGPRVSDIVLWPRPTSGTLVDCGCGIVAFASDINDRGQAIGFGFFTLSGGGNRSGMTAVLLENGKTTELAGLPLVPDTNPITATVPLSINNRGQVVGSATTGSTEHAVFWEHGTTQPVDLGASLRSPSAATAINDRGQAVGALGIPTTLVGSIVLTSGAQAVLWDLGRHRAGEPGPGTTAVTRLGSFIPTAINTRGQVAGIRVDPNGTQRAVVWDRGQLRVLPLLPGAAVSIALDINDRGDVVGAIGGHAEDIRGRSVTGTPQAVLWDEDGVERLPPLAGDTTSVARSINDRQQIVGSSGSHAVLWQDRAGR